MWTPLLELPLHKGSRALGAQPSLCSAFPQHLLSLRPTVGGKVWDPEATDSDVSSSQSRGLDKLLTLCDATATRSPLLLLPSNCVPLPKRAVLES